jgi:membrane protease YdiL (CAAX protease family)
MDGYRRVTEQPLQSTAVIAATIALSTVALYLIVGNILSTLLALTAAIAVVGLTLHAIQTEQPESKRELLAYLTDFHPPKVSGLLLVSLAVMGGFAWRIMVGLSKDALAPTTQVQAHQSVSQAPPELLSLLFLATFVVIVGPLFEEIIFRAMGQRFASKVIHPALAILITSVVFAIMHVPSYGGFSTPLLQLLFPISVAFMDSLIWGALYHKTQNTTYPLLAHSTSNLIAVVVWVL